MPNPKPILDEITSLSALDNHFASKYITPLLPDDSVLNKKNNDYSLYRETLRDTHCYAAFQQRRKAVTSCEWSVSPGAEDELSKNAASWMQEQLQTINWDDITDKMLYGLWYGYAVSEVLYNPDLIENKISLLDIKVRDRSKFYFDGKTYEPYIYKNGIYTQLPERKFWCYSSGAEHSDNPYGLGLAHYCYWPVFFKRNNIKFWLIFLEKFGMPTVVATMPAGQYQNQNMREQVLNAIESMASETGIVIPEGSSFDFPTSSSSGTQDYSVMINEMNDSITKVIIGQLASSEGTPGQLGNSDTQEDVRKELLESDCRLINQSFSNTVSKWLTEWNFPNATAPWVTRKTETEENLDSVADRDTKLFNIGFERTELSFTDTYGDGYQKRDMSNVAYPQQSNFAEKNIATLVRQRDDDQQKLIEQSKNFASKYQMLLGGRVQQLLSYAHQTNDFSTFKKKLREMMQEPAPDNITAELEKGGVNARLAGMLREQKEVK